MKTDDDGYKIIHKNKGNSDDREKESNKYDDKYNMIDSKWKWMIEKDK